MSSLINNKYINALEGEFSPEVKALSRALDSGAEAFDLVWLAFVGMYIMQSKQIESQVEDLEEKLKEIETLQKWKQAIKKGETEQTLFSELEDGSSIVDVETIYADDEKTVLYKEYTLSNGYKIRIWENDDPSTLFFNEKTGAVLVENYVGGGTAEYAGNDKEKAALENLDWSGYDPATNNRYVYQLNKGEEVRFVFAESAEAAEKANSGWTVQTNQPGEKVPTFRVDGEQREANAHIQIVDQRGKVILSIFDFKDGGVMLYSPQEGDNPEDFKMVEEEDLSAHKDYLLELGGGVEILLDLHTNDSGGYLKSFAVVDEDYHFGGEFTFNPKDPTAGPEVDSEANSYYLEEKYYQNVEYVLNGFEASVTKKERSIVTYDELSREELIIFFRELKRVLINYFDELGIEDTESIWINIPPYAQLNNDNRFDTETYKPYTIEGIISLIELNEEGQHSSELIGIYTFLANPDNLEYLHDMGQNITFQYGNQAGRSDETYEFNLEVQKTFEDFYNQEITVYQSSVQFEEFNDKPRSIKDTQAYAESEEYLRENGVIDTDGDGEYYDDFIKFLEEELSFEIKTENGKLADGQAKELGEVIDSRIETLTSLNQIDMLYLQRNFNNLNLIVTALSNIESSKHRADNVVANNMG